MAQEIYVQRIRLSLNQKRLCGSQQHREGYHTQAKRCLMAHL
ncbi:hypothetical protein [Nitrospira sp. Ecomares 2.1]